MNRTRRTRIGVLALVLAAAACGTQDPDETATSTATAVDSGTTAAAGPADPVPAASVEPDPGVRLYPTLTDYAWYARGEALQHEGVAYLPAGAPVTAAVSDMQHAGEFESVDYYVRSGLADGAVYVPVYRGYWQPFRADTSQ